MAKKPHSKIVKSAPKRQIPRLWLAVGGALLLVVGGLSLVWRLSTSTTGTLDTAPEVTGAPRLAVDREVVDEGYIKLNNAIRTTFRLKNVGEQPLRILGEPVVELVEGC